MVELDNRKAEKLQSCIAYFKERPIYEQILRGLRKKYEGFGVARGTVKLVHPTKEQLEQVTGFFGVNIFTKKDVSITAKKFQQGLDNSKFAGISMEEVLEAYFGETLVTRQQKEERFAHSWEQFCAEQIEQFTSLSYVKFIQNAIEKKNAAYTFIKKKFKEAPQQLGSLLRSVDAAAAQLPVCTNEIQRLPVFATKITGNPHYFDENTEGTKLLSYYIQYREEEQQEIPIFFAELKWERFYRVGILKDDLSNHVLTYGLCAIKENNTTHLGLEGYATEREPVHISLYTLSQLRQIEVWKHVDAVKKRVYVVENPAIFAALVEHVEPDQHVGVVCGNGQLHLAALVLLDKLVENGYMLYYSGDFDPEGLQIADKLKRKYKEHLVLWCYEEQFYEKSCSEVELSEERLKKLERIQDQSLVQIAKKIYQQKRAGYQEAIVEDLKQDMQDNM